MTVHVFRPHCDVPGCDKLAQNTNTTLKPRYRRSKWVAEEYGGVGHVCAKHHAIKYRMGDWEYKVHRKTYCENTDGRLGFTCTTNIIDPEWQLDADHINGNPSDCSAENIQTLCKCCHAIKTRDSRDWETAGRSFFKNVDSA